MGGEVFVNGQAQVPPPLARVPWVTCKGARVERRAAEVATDPLCPLRRYHAPRQTRAEATFPANAGTTETDVAPLRVPRHGDTLALTFNAWPRVRDLLRLEGQAPRLLPGGAVALRGRVLERYVVQDDYYYVLGDHRSASNDSRVWGFVPRRALIGRAALVHYSAEPKTGRPRWSRVGRPVR